MILNEYRPDPNVYRYRKIGRDLYACESKCGTFSFIGTPQQVSDAVKARDEEQRLLLGVSDKERIREYYERVMQLREYCERVMQRERLAIDSLGDAPQCAWHGKLQVKLKIGQASIEFYTVFGADGIYVKVRDGADCTDTITAISHQYRTCHQMLRDWLPKYKLVPIKLRKLDPSIPEDNVMLERYLGIHDEQLT